LRKIWRYLALPLIGFAMFVFFNNTSLLAPQLSGKPVLLAHRGIAQRFDPVGVTNDTCTASRMQPPTHGYLENTIASMLASFEAGADIVELDVHPTTGRWIAAPMAMVSLASSPCPSSGRSTLAMATPPMVAKHIRSEAEASG
jgi:hypothetical protein